MLVGVQGKPVADPTAMLNLVAALAPGAPAKMKLKRQGQDVDGHSTSAAVPSRSRAAAGQVILFRLVHERLDAVGDLADREDAVEVTVGAFDLVELDVVALRLQLLRARLAREPGGKIRSVLAGRNGTFALMRALSFSTL